uniref:hypothetical protein n=1 Tax=uncultured Rhizobium sp. TaxID=155567 RepID=UPI00260A5304|nr:hypothetical protein [uncultured Rhizobium sp.]
MRSSQTIGSVLRLVFPKGTNLSADGTLQSMPILPTDVFAGVGILIEYSGIYHRIKPASLSESNAEDASKVEQYIDLPLSAKRIELSAEEIISGGVNCWVRLGKAWRQNSDINNILDKLWRVITKDLDQSVVVITQADDSRLWLKAALALFAISDEACEGLGYVNGSWFELAFRRAEGGERAEIIDDKFPLHLRTSAKDGSMCVLADENVVCVMPKSRTPMVGCTLRTMSHNLALLPPPHKASAFWYRPPTQLEKNTKPLNLLLVPFPYEINATDFRTIEMEPSYAPQFDRWGEFDLAQSWLGKIELVNFIDDLIAASEKKGTIVEGIVFPEYALNWDNYEKLVDSIRSKHKHIKFLVSGSSEDGVDGVVRSGNFVLTTMFYDDNNGGGRIAVTSGRGKHHRWRLNGPQVESYCLDSVLDANTFWWENIDLTERRISSTVFRERSVFTTLICEDLARSEPVHSVLQSIGPNLVFVLLMDGPQLKDRWAARNATGLAEDPGSSVLTFTCRGLLHRQKERVGGPSANYTIALWKDDTQRVKEIVCLPDHDAVVVTLSAARARETTLDGRSNADAWAWRMSGYQPLSRN